MRAAWRLVVDPTKCAGRGLCAEVLPELVQLDDWGFPVLAHSPVPAGLLRMARRAVTICPELALFLEPVSGPSRSSGASGGRRVGTGPTGPTSAGPHPRVEDRRRKEPPVRP